MDKKEQKNLCGVLQKAKFAFWASQNLELFGARILVGCL